MAIARSSAGKARTTSMHAHEDVVEPAAGSSPRSRPMSVPMRIANPTVTNPTCSDDAGAVDDPAELVAAGCESRPMMCCGWSAGQPSRWMHGGCPRFTPGLAGRASTRSDRTGRSAGAKIATISERPEDDQADDRGPLAQDVARSCRATGWPGCARVRRRARSARSACCSMAVIEADPRVEEGVRDVHDEVDDDVDRRRPRA